MIKYENKDYITYAEAQKIYPLSIRTYQRYIKAGLIDRIVVGRKAYLLKSDLNSIVRKG